VIPKLFRHRRTQIFGIAYLPLRLVLFAKIFPDWLLKAILGQINLLSALINLNV